MKILKNLVVIGSFALLASTAAFAKSPLKTLNCTNEPPCCVPSPFGDGGCGSQPICCLSVLKNPSIRSYYEQYLNTKFTKVK